MLSLSNASLIGGITLGTIIGYTLNSTGDLLNNALIATSCGVSRAFEKAIFMDPIRNQLLCNLNLTDDHQIASEMTALSKKYNVVHTLYQATLGFGHGIALGSSLSATSLPGAVQNGFLIHIANFSGEIIPALALRKPLQLKFNEEGKPIS